MNILLKHEALEEAEKTTEKIKKLSSEEDNNLIAFIKGYELGKLAIIKDVESVETKEDVLNVQE